MHPPPPSSIHLHSAHFNLNPAPPSSFQPPPSSLQHFKRYKNQNIARNWKISLKLGGKIQSCPFYVEIGIHGIMEVLIPNPQLKFWNSDTKIFFLSKLAPKKSNWSVVSENRHIWYLGEAHSASRVRFSKFRPQNSFLSKLQSHSSWSKSFASTKPWNKIKIA